MQPINFQQASSIDTSWQLVDSIVEKPIIHRALGYQSVYDRRLFTFGLRDKNLAQLPCMLTSSLTAIQSKSSPIGPRPNGAFSLATEFS